MLMSRRHTAIEYVARVGMHVRGESAGVGVAVLTVCVNEVTVAGIRMRMLA